MRERVLQERTTVQGPTCWGCLEIYPYKRCKWVEQRKMGRQSDKLKIPCSRLPGRLIYSVGQEPCMTSYLKIRSVR